MSLLSVASFASPKLHSDVTEMFRQILADSQAIRTICQIDDDNAPDSKTRHFAFFHDIHKIFTFGTFSIQDFQLKIK